MRNRRPDDAPLSRAQLDKLAVFATSLAELAEQAVLARTEGDLRRVLPYLEALDRVIAGRAGWQDPDQPPDDDGIAAGEEYDDGDEWKMGGD